MVQCHHREQACNGAGRAVPVPSLKGRGHQKKMRALVTLNVGLLVEKTGGEISRAEAAQALIEHGVEPIVSLLHEAQWEGKPQPTLVVLAQVPHNWSADALADTLEQDAIAVLEHGPNGQETGYLYGRNPKGWGFDRREFVSLDQARAAYKASAA